MTDDLRLLAMELAFTEKIAAGSKTTRSSSRC